MECTLKKKQRLYRCYEIITPEGRFEVEYFAKAMGYEYVLVQQSVAEFKTKRWWYAPRYEFVVGSLLAVLEVDFWPWCQIKTIKISVGGVLVYTE